jgi:hypothetical protein
MSIGSERLKDRCRDHIFMVNPITHAKKSPRSGYHLNGVLVKGLVEGLDRGTGRPGERPNRHSTRVRITLPASVITVI